MRQSGKEKTASLRGPSGFTLVELIATIAIVAILAVVLVVFIGGYIQDAKRTADQQTLAVLNDALTRYKTQGGSLAALTVGADIQNVLTELRTPISWAGMQHQVLKTGDTYASEDLSVSGNGSSYKFTRYGTYIDGTSYASNIVSDVGGVSDPEAFESWMANAMAETGSTNYLALTNPDTTDRFGIYARVANSGDKVRVWWGDGTTQDYDSISTSSSTIIAKNFGSSAARTIVIVGDVSRLTANSAIEDELKFGGDISTMTSLTYVYLPNYYNGSIWKASEITVGGDIRGLTGLTYLLVHGSNTISGSVSRLTGLTVLDAGGSNTISGDVSGLTGLTRLSIGGSNTLSGDVSGLTGLTYLNVGGSNMLSGSVSGLTGLTALSVWGSNTLSGDVSGLTSLTVLSAGGSNTISGDVSGLTGLTFLSVWGSNTLSGDVSGLTGLTYLGIGGNSSLNTASLVSITGSATGLSYLIIGSQYTLNQTQTDTILTNMDANKSETKPRSERIVDINEGNHAAPSATGLAAKTNLVNAGWTVNTK